MKSGCHPGGYYSAFDKTWLDRRFNTVPNEQL
jgi:hypothetical protein